MTFEELSALSRGPITDAPCPTCGPRTRHGSNRTRKVLRIWNDGQGFLNYVCARCGARGWAKDDQASGPRATRQDAPSCEAPVPIPDNSALARQLWLLAQPLAGSPAEAYLAARKCPVVSPNLRYLPSRAGRPHAMVARFQGSDGIHITYLSPDGLAKADVEKQKIMLGPSKGCPIPVWDHPERAELVIAEGIEDAATLGLIMDVTAWAAGSAGRIGPVVPSQGWENVWLAVDQDEAGERALRDARAVNRDIIPLQIGKALRAADRMDANKALMMYGESVLIQAIDWCDIQDALKRKRIDVETARRRVGRLQLLMAA